MLEDADHQHAVVAGDDVLGAVAVVHVEVDDRHPRQAARVERMARGDGHVVEEAEAHRLVARGMVPGRAHGAERAGGAAGDDVVGGRHGSAGRAQHRVPGGGAGRGVGVDSTGAAGGPDRFEQVAQLGHVAAAVGQLDVAQVHLRGIAHVERHVEAGGAQVVVDRVQPLRAFRVAPAHLVAATIGVGVERRGHQGIASHDRRSVGPGHFG